MFYVLAFREINTGNIHLEVTDQEPQTYVIKEYDRTVLGSIENDPDTLQRFADGLPPIIDNLFTEPISHRSRTSCDPGIFEGEFTAANVLHYAHKIVSAAKESVQRMGRNRTLTPPLQ